MSATTADLLLFLSFILFAMILFPPFVWGLIAFALIIGLVYITFTTWL